MCINICITFELHYIHVAGDSAGPYTKCNDPDGSSSNGEITYQTYCHSYFDYCGMISMKNQNNCYNKFDKIGISLVLIPINHFHDFKGNCGGLFHTFHFLGMMVKYLCVYNQKKWVCLNMGLSENRVYSQL